MRYLMLSLLGTILLGGVISCTAQTPAAPQIPVTAPGKPEVKAAWESKWESALAEAKKEGKVSIYSIWRPSTREAVTKAFKDRYGITVEFTAFARGPDLLARVQAEKRAGLYLADIFGAGVISLLASLKPAEVLGSMENLLILPEVTDPKAWNMGQVPFMDKDKTSVAMISSIQRFVFYNTNMVKPDEITLYKDALKPVFKDRVTLFDPTVPGPGNAFISHLAFNTWNVDEANDYLKQLVKQQNVTIIRDGRLHVESVARGKFALGLAPLPDVLEEFIALGSPIAAVIMKEGANVAPAAGAMAVPTKFANPNAAQIFVNWLLSKEGQTVFSKSFGNPSTRADVSTEGFRPLWTRQPEDKLIFDNEEFTLFQGKMQGIARQTIDDALK